MSERAAGSSARVVMCFQGPSDALLDAVARLAGDATTGNVACPLAKCR